VNEIYHSLPSNVEVKNVGATSPLHPLIKHMNVFTFTLNYMSGHGFSKYEPQNLFPFPLRDAGEFSRIWFCPDIVSGKSVIPNEGVFK
jgi:hypothetical protein